MTQIKENTNLTQRQLTVLEEKINQLWDRKRALENKVQRAEEKPRTDRDTEYYTKEFTSICEDVYAMLRTGIDKDFISWADSQEIKYTRGEINDGTSFFRYLLTNAQQRYCSSRYKGFEEMDAFEIATAELEYWIIKVDDEKRNSGIIYINGPRNTQWIRNKILERQNEK